MSPHLGYLDLKHQEPDFADEVRASMAFRPRSLPPGALLDAVGHALYARITMLPGYTLARAEAELIRTQAQSILSRAGNPREVVDFQSASATQVRPLLSHVERYVGIDRCQPVLEDAIVGLRAAFPALNACGIVGGSTKCLATAARGHGPRLVVMFGGALGSLDPTDARLTLAKVRSTMASDDFLLVGIDLAKDPRRLKDAYHDPAGVHAAYLRNALRRLNRELRTDFEPSDWEPFVEVQPNWSRVVGGLRAKRKVTVDAGQAGEAWSFEAGESIHLEQAYKPSEGQVAAMALGAGFTLTDKWHDCANAFALFLLKP